MQERRSQLPQSPEYWDRLAERIGADAAGPLAGYAAADAWYGVLARRASWLVAAAAVLITALLLTLPRTPDITAYRLIEQAVAPDERAGTLISGRAAPTVEQLLPEFPPASPREEG